MIRNEVTYSIFVQRGDEDPYPLVGETDFSKKDQAELAARYYTINEEAWHQKHNPEGAPPRAKYLVVKVMSSFEIQ